MQTEFVPVCASSPSTYTTARVFGNVHDAQHLPARFRGRQSASARSGLAGVGVRSSKDAFLRRFAGLLSMR